MSGSDTQAKGIGPVPILFVTVGGRAEQTINAFSRIAKGLTVPVQGPFGLLSISPAGRRLSVGHWTWLSDFDVPTSSQDTDSPDDALSPAVASLIRTLQSKEPAADPSRPGRIRLSSYVLIDLSEQKAVDRALQVMKLLRKTDPAHDMAVVAITGRTAASTCELDDVWFDTWNRLTARLQDELLAQKVYLLDGRNASGTWFERPEQMDRFCAEFLLQHGITCRAALRQNERRRISPQENVLNVCGSFGLRRIDLDLPEVIERTAQRLVHDELASLYEETLSEDRRKHIDEEAQSLAEQIERMYQEDSLDENGGKGESAAAYNLGVRNEQVCDAVAETVAQTCGRAPLASLCHLLHCLQPRLRRLMTRHKLIERQRLRGRVAEMLRHQDEETYQPMRVWLEKTDASWSARFKPIEETRIPAAVSRPATDTAWRFGLLFLVIGLAGLTAGLFFQERAFVFGGALLALAATVLATQPTGWTEHTRTVVPDDHAVSQSIPAVPYRRQASLTMRTLTMGCAAVGIVVLAWSLWPDLWTSAMLVRAMAAGLLGIVGVSLILTGPVQMRADQLKHQEAPDHLGPPFWAWRTLGLLCLASGWLVLCLKAPSPLQDGASLRWASHAGGLLLVAVAAVAGLKPRIGRIRLIERIPRIPKPVGGIDVAPAESNLIREVSAIVQWIDRLILDPRQGLLRHGMPDPPQGHEVLFDFIAADWDRQLAEGFRHTLRTRMGQSLRDLALEPKAWAQCIVRHLQNPQAQSGDLGVLFTLEVVKVWIDSLSVTDLAGCLETDRERFAHLLGRSASPNWPGTRVGPDINISVAAVGSALWDALAPLAQSEGTFTVVRRDWDARKDGILILQIVQGLTQGWRGYPALPSQLHEQRRLDGPGVRPPNRPSAQTS